MPFVADWATTAALLAVLLAEGIRRLPAGAIVLRRTLWGSWRIAHGPTVRPEWRLVSIWAPFFEHLVIQVGTAGDLVVADEGDRAGEPRRYTPSRLTIAAFRIAGGALFLVVAIALPMATATFGITGLVRGIALALLGSTTIAVAAALNLRARIGWNAAVKRAAPMLSPFTAPRAAEWLCETTMHTVPAAAALHALVRREDFQRWFRTHAYDTLAARDSMLDQEPRKRLEAMIAVVPEDCGDDDRFCPRCAAVYRSHMEECSDCTSVVLRGGSCVMPPVGTESIPSRREALPTGSRSVERLARSAR